MALTNLNLPARVNKKLTHFEVKLDEEYIFLRGGSSDTPEFPVSGHLLLMNQESISTKEIRIKLRGQVKTRHCRTNRDDPGPPTTMPFEHSSRVLDSKLIINNDQDGRPLVFPSGNHTIPFSITVPGDIPESIEGLFMNHIRYEIKATVDRGLLNKDLVSSKPVRFIRTLGRDPVQFMDPVDVMGLWVDKVKYSFSLLSKAIIFGDSITTFIQLTPLKEKITINRVKIRLEEIKKIKTNSGPDFDFVTNRWGGMWKSASDVATKTVSVPNDCMTTDPELQLPMLNFKTVFPLPKSLKDCRQDTTSSDRIRIKHMMHYSVQIRNPEGHMSELRAHHQIFIFISPNMPPGDNDEVAAVELGPASALNPLHDIQNAPPMYREHRLDPLYEEVNATQGALTGVDTPAFGPSRRNSADNLAEMGNQNTIGNDMPLPSNLARRLEGISEQNGEVPSVSSSQASHSALNGYLTASGTQTPVMGTSHVEDSAPTMGASHVEDLSAIHQDSYNMDELERMPSYGAAVRTPIRTLREEMPPSYDTSTSRPSSS